MPIYNKCSSKGEKDSVCIACKGKGEVYTIVIVSRNTTILNIRSNYYNIVINDNIVLFL